MLLIQKDIHIRSKKKFEDASIKYFMDTLPFFRVSKQSLSFPHELLLTEKGNDSLSQTSIYHAIFDEAPTNSHQAPGDVKSLLEIIRSDVVFEFIVFAEIEKIGLLFEKIDGKKGVEKKKSIKKKKKKKKKETRTQKNKQRKEKKEYLALYVTKKNTCQTQRVPKGQQRNKKIFFVFLFFFFFLFFFLIDFN